MGTRDWARCPIEGGTWEETEEIWEDTDGEVWLPDHPHTMEMYKKPENHPNYNLCSQHSLHKRYLCYSNSSQLLSYLQFWRTTIHVSPLINCKGNYCFTDPTGQGFTSIPPSHGCEYSPFMSPAYTLHSAPVDLEDWYIVLPKTW